jgi:hypothetical protein
MEGEVVTPLGLLILVLLVLAVWKRSLFLLLLAASGGLPLGVALVFAGQSLPAFYAVGAVAGVMLLATTLVSRRTGRALVRQSRPGANALLLFVAWTIFVTAVAPFVFRGVSVLVARGGIDEQFLDPGTLDYTVSNVAQIVYLIIGVAIVFFVSGSRTSVVGLVSLMLGVITVLSFWRLLSLYAGVPFPVGFFDNATSFRIIESAPGGAARFRGIFAEPSSLGAACITAIVFFTLRLPWLSRVRRVGAGAIILMAIVNAAMSTAGTFVAAGLVMLAIVALYGVRRFVLGSARVPVGAVVAGLVVLMFGAFFIPTVVELVNSIINEKVSSSSYGSRTGVDIFSYRLTLQTWGFGVGLGSNRPSSFLAMLLSCVGIPGTVLFSVALFRISRAAWDKPEYRPVVWALVSVLVCKIISGPNLSDPAATLYITLGVLAHGAWKSPTSPVEGLAPGFPGRTLDEWAPRGSTRVTPPAR